MKSRDSIFLTLLWSGLFLSFFTLHARDYSATPLPFASSLPSREITSLHQDREGMIWIGTTHGVARYDGYETIVFKSDPLHPDLLTDNSITLITDTERTEPVRQTNMEMDARPEWSVLSYGNQICVH